MSVTKEKLVSMVDGIAVNEKFKQDAFFFCGYPTDKPNEVLMKACRKYVEAAKDGDAPADVKETLVAALKDAIEKGSEVEGVKNMHSNEADIKTILENVESL